MLKIHGYLQIAWLTSIGRFIKECGCFEVDCWGAAVAIVIWGEADASSKRVSDVAKTEVLMLMRLIMI